MESIKLRKIEKQLEILRKQWRNAKHQVQRNMIELRARELKRGNKPNRFALKPEEIFR